VRVSIAVMDRRTIMFLRSLWKGLFGRNTAPEFIVDPGNHKVPTAAGLLVLVDPPASIDLGLLESQFYEVLFDSPIEDAELNVPQKLVLDAVKFTLSDPDQRSNCVPQLPAVIPRLMRSLRDAGTSGKDYINIINKDPVLSAAVVRLANSAYYNHSAVHIESIDRAVIKLGVDGLRSVLSAAVMQPIIQRNSPYFNQFGLKLWQHSLCCAVTCELLASREALEPYKAYLLGLAHDLGKITIFSELCKQFKLNSPDDRPGCKVFVPLIKDYSNQLSARIAQDWDLPNNLCLALNQQVLIGEGKPVGDYARILYRANLACEFYAAGGHEHPENAANMIAELDLPADLFQTLGSLAVEI